MKKIKSFVLIGLWGIILVACGSEEEAIKATPEEDSSSEVSSEEASSEIEENTEISDTTYEGDSGTYEITAVEQMKSTFVDAQIIAVTMNYTNNTEEIQSPWLAWSLDISATQETDATVENLMEANGLFPEDYKSEAVAMGDSDIKPGATVEVVVGHEIMFPGKPVFLENFNLKGEDGDSFQRTIETISH